MSMITITLDSKYLPAVSAIMALVDNTVPMYGTDEPLEETADWTQEKVKRMFEESPPSMKKMLGYLSTRPGQAVTAAEVNAAVGAGKNLTVAGALGAFSRRVANRYKMADNPFTSRYNVDTQRREYVMSQKMATMVAAVLAK